MGQIAIIGAGIGGLALALELHARDVPCQVYEAAPEIRALGVGINVLPHASRHLARLGLEDELTRLGVLTSEAVFFNRFGQELYRESVGRAAGFTSPQYSIHRGDLLRVLHEAVLNRLGPRAVHTDHRCSGAKHDGDQVRLTFAASSDGTARPDVVADVVVGCDGIHSALRKRLHPNEGEPRYSGVNMWRGTTVMEPFLSGSSMVRAGWLDKGKLVTYPIRDDVDGNGHQLINWVAEIETPHHVARDWGRRGRLEDFIGAFEGWTFDWLDVPKMMRDSLEVLEYPMVDQPPLDRWTDGRITLLGDAAHPMVPRGSNGAGQAIVDAELLARLIDESPDAQEALSAYELERLPATTQVVELNLKNPPDAIIREVRDRTGDEPFENLDDFISQDELRQITDHYRQATGLTHTRQP